MTVEVALVISGLSLAFGVFSGISSMRRNAKTDTQHDAAQLTTVIVKLEGLSAGIADIKSELAVIKADTKELRERIVIVEQSAKSAHKRLDEHLKGEL